KEKNYYRKRMAEALASNGKGPEAIATLRSVLKGDPKDSEARLLLGRNLIASGDLNLAIAELRAAVDADSQNSVARYLLGSALVQQGQLELAVPEFQKSIQLDPKYLEPRLQLAQVQILLDQDEGAIKTSQNILDDVNARSLDAKLLHAAALRKLGRLDEARAELQATRKLMPRSPDVLIQLGELEFAAK